MSGLDKTSARRPGRQEIVDLLRACAAKNGGKAPGRGFFLKTCGITRRYACTFDPSRMNLNFEEHRENLARKLIPSGPDSRADRKNFSSVFDNGCQSNSLTFG
jgi:hypothetical protein